MKLSENTKAWYVIAAIVFAWYFGYSVGRRLYVPKDSCVIGSSLRLPNGDWYQCETANTWGPK